MKTKALRQPMLLVASVLITLGVVELGLRWLVQPAEQAYGTLFGRELPPLRIVRGSDEPDRSAWDEFMVIDGVRVSRGDLWGHYRPDPLLGYAPRESVVSTNGWWQSNNLGARAREDVGRAVPAGKKRVLVFGESFAHGSRLPQERAWPSIVDAAHPAMQVLNFAVDGYSMSQAVLRYRQIRRSVDYDVALLMFVPEADLWRDLSIVRWSTIMPRFGLEDGKLALRLPGGDSLGADQDAGGGMNARLHEYLLRHDRFYFPAMYDQPPLVGRSMLYKVGVLAYAEWKNRGLHAGVMNPQGEALQVSRALFAAIQGEVQADGAQFRLLILPAKQKWREMPHADTWEKMVSFVCADGIACIDLLDELERVPVDEIDYAYDGAHYGPGTNARIACVIGALLDDIRHGSSAHSRPESGRTYDDQPADVSGCDGADDLRDDFRGSGRAGRATGC